MSYTGGRAWKAIEDRILKPCYLIREDHNRKITTKVNVLVNIPSQMGILKAEIYCLQVY